jgi:thiol-disulfide isomerase/thioredoxin
MSSRTCRVVAVLPGLFSLLAASPGLVGAAEPKTPDLPDTVTFSDHIAPIVFTQCTSCHRPGQAAPFALMNYSQVRKHARTIVRAVSSRYMPPWQPEPGYGEFLHERRLTELQIGLIKKWVNTGMAEGDSKRLPPLPEFPAGWQVGEPGLIVALDRDFEVPADGPDIYQNFVLPLNLKEDKWVKAVEFQATAPTVVHHVLFQLDNSGRARKLDAEQSKPGKPGFPGMGFRPTGSVGTWAVGGVPQKLPGDLAYALDQHSDLVLQVHFHPTGKAEKCRLTVGIHFADKTPSRTLLTPRVPPAFGLFAGIDIPAGKADYTLRESFTFPADADLVGIFPHAHFLGKSFKMDAQLPDKTTRHLLWIKDWDFNWQDVFFYKNSVRLPKGTVLQLEIVWDNSANNPRNPRSPPVRVTWGEGSFDEMGAVGLKLVAANENDYPALRKGFETAFRTALQKSIQRGDKLTLELVQQSRARAKNTAPTLVRSTPQEGPASASPPPTPIPDVDGKFQEPLKVAGDKAHVLFFLTHDCPISNGYAPEIASIVKQYADKGVRFYAVHVDPDCTAEVARKHAREFGLPCPVLLDPKHQLVKATGVTITPEVAVLTPDGKVAYRGRIDDQYPGLGKKRIAPAERDLRQALDAILAGKPVKVARTEAVGCSIPDLP